MHSHGAKNRNTWRILVSGCAALILSVTVSGCATKPAAQPTPAPATPPAAPAAPPAADKAAAPAAAAKAASPTADALLDALNKLAPEERQKQLEEGAKRDGKVVLYGTTSVDWMESLLNEFRAKYPGVKVEYVRGTTDQLLTRILTEARAGKLGADVLDLTAPEMLPLRNENILAQYVSPERKAWHASFFDPDGYWYGRSMEPEVIVYNTKLVTKEQAPKSFEDLTNPRWKGLIGASSMRPRWIAGMLKFYGEEKGLDLVRRIAAQNVLLNDSNTNITNAAAAGEIQVAFDQHLSTVEKTIAKKAPLGWNYTDPLFGHLNVVAINKKTPRQYASALLVDFELSRAGQEAYARGEWTSGRLDVKYPHTEILKAPNLLMYSPAMVGQGTPLYDKFQKLHESLFVRR